MRLIDIKAFLEREKMMSKGWKVDDQTKVLEFRDDEATPYAILSHRWIDPTEIDFVEMVDLARVDKRRRDEIRRRLGYKKILDSCQQAQRDGYEWLWIDTCCIDKRSSAELSEAINSMYWWYENSGVCYAYLHDVLGSSFPTTRDKQKYLISNGWPEWFSRGWTLQEMIAPRNVQFFNNTWRPIGEKRTLASILQTITGVPMHILTDGLSGNRPCIGQIMSWASDRITTRVEDKAYSLMGLLDVNMPMLYGEGKKAFHRLQLEIIRTSNDQSVFAWGCNSANVRSGSILADDPSFFSGCDEMVPMKSDEFVEILKKYIPKKELAKVEEDRFGVFPITNRGIQIWLFLRPYRSSRSVFQAWLPYRYGPSGPPVSINLALWDSNYYRHSSSVLWYNPTDQNLEFRQLYLRYQDTYRDVTFEIDDNSITENGFTCDRTSQPTGNMLTLTGASPRSVRIYSDRQTNCRFAVTFGQCFGQDWISCIGVSEDGLSWSDEQEMLVSGPERAQFMAEAPSRGERYGRVWFNHTCLRGSTWIVRTSRVVWERSRIGVRMEIFRQPGFQGDPSPWRVLDIEVSRFFAVCTPFDHFQRASGPGNREMRGLMLCGSPCKPEHTLCIDGTDMAFFLIREGVKARVHV